MDVNTLRILITLVTLSTFLGIVCWAYRPSRRATLERIGSSILKDDAP